MRWHVVELLISESKAHYSTLMSEAECIVFVQYFHRRSDQYYYFNKEERDRFHLRFMDETSLRYTVLLSSLEKDFGTDQLDNEVVRLVFECN